MYPKVPGLGLTKSTTTTKTLVEKQPGSQNSDKTTSSGRNLYHLQFSFQAASPVSFGYTLVCLLLHMSSSPGKILPVLYLYLPDVI
jgi:hypothetical protein